MFFIILHGILYIVYHTSDHILHIIPQILYCIDIRNYILFVVHCTINYIISVYTFNLIYHILCIMHCISYIVFHILYMYHSRCILYMYYVLYTFCICIMYLGLCPKTARVLFGASRFHAPGTGCSSTIRSASRAPRESRAFRAFRRVARLHTMNSRGLNVAKLHSL